jgi:hypothetical protein
VSFKIAIYSIIGVLVLHAVLLTSGAYEILPNIDILMHLLGGFSMGLLGMAIHHSVASKHHTMKSPIWYHYCFVVGFAMLIGVAWEFHEYILDNTVHIWYNFPITQPSLADTMADFLNDWIGASVAFFWLKKRL